MKYQVNFHPVRKNQWISRKSYALHHVEGLFVAFKQTLVPSFHGQLQHIGSKKKKLQHHFVTSFELKQSLVQILSSSVLPCSRYPVLPQASLIFLKKTNVQLTSLAFLYQRLTTYLVAGNLQEQEMWIPYSLVWLAQLVRNGICNSQRTENKNSQV